MESKIAFCALFTFSTISLSAQQRPYYTQYILNNYILNPAVAGIENYWDVKASHRHQWAGLEGAPVTTYFTVHGPLSSNNSGRNNPTTARTPGENPRGSNFLDQYQSADPHHGLGVTLLNDKAGPINRFAAYATYAYHLPLSETVSLGAGVSAGVQNISLKPDMLNFGNAYPVDPVVAQSAYINNVRPDIGLGLMAYGARWFAGFSMQQIISQKISFDNGKLSGDSVTLLEGKLVPHMFLQAGYRVLAGDDFSFLPSVTAKYVNPVPLSFDINLKLMYRDIAWFGTSIRPDDGFAVMAGFNISSAINFGYSYDYTSTELNNVSNGTHEIVIGFTLGNSYGDWCPRNIW